MAAITNHLTRLTVRAKGRLADAHARAVEESEQGSETVEKAIIVSAAALMAIAAMALIAAAISGKLGGLSL